MKKFIEKNKIKLISLGIVIYFILIYIFSIKVNIPDVCFIGAIVIGIIVVISNINILNEYEKNKKINFNKLILAIGIIGIVLRSVYILYTPLTERQHDLEANVGHLAYIETIYNTGKLPEHNKWQFYQQPLHHIISAGWLKINSIFGVDLKTSEEGIQILTAIYSSIIMVIAYCILKELKISDKLKVLVMAVIAVHPTFIILSGSINNDILMWMFTFLDLLYLIKWNKNSSMKNTVILAFITALIALTKISGTIIAIPILYIFINKFFKDYFKEKDKKVIKNYIVKFAIFGFISLGLGLLFSIRNMILFRQSIFYVPQAGMAIYCGDRSLFERFDILSKEWINIFCYPYTDCNIFAYLVKSSLFGEYALYGNNDGNVIALLLLIVNILIIIKSIISLIKLSGKNNSEEIKMIIIFYFVEIFMYLYSNLTMPFGCTMDFRYIVPTVFFGMIFIVKELKDKDYKKTSMLIGSFSIISIIFELTYMNVLTI